MSHEAPHRAVRPDPALSATVLARTPLRYADGADVSLDRPAWVRAASAVRRVGARLVFAQDDAAFVAWQDADGSVRSVPMPMSDGVRIFDEGRGNKKRKLDLEAAFVWRVAGEDVFVALGSGSTAARERVVVTRFGPDGARTPEVIDAHALYAALRGCVAFCGSELNLEGAVALPGGDVQLIQRGNGAASESLAPVDATCVVSGSWWDALLSGREVAPPELRDVTSWDLGDLDGCRLTFTDAVALSDDRIWFTASAEDSPDTYRDGEVVGSVVGWISSTGAGYTRLIDADGRPLRDKVEGIERGDAPDRVLLVVDADDPSRPAERLDVGLVGFPRED